MATGFCVQRPIEACDGYSDAAKELKKEIADMNEDDPIDEDQRQAVGDLFDRIISILEQVQEPNRLLYQDLWKRENVSLNLTLNLAHDTELLGRFITGANEILHPAPVLLEDPADDKASDPAPPAAAPSQNLQGVLGGYGFVKQAAQPRLT